MQTLLAFFVRQFSRFTKKNGSRGPFFLFAVTLAFSLFFGLSHLGKFQTSDEDLWYADPATGRIHTYWNAVLKGDWEQTRINDKPGVTTALLGYWGYRNDTDGSEKMIEKEGVINRYNPVAYERIAVSHQLPFVIANILLILLLFWLARAYTENAIFAVLFAGFIALTPILIGISQIVNPDATLWSLGFSAFFSYLLFLKTNQFRWILLGSILFGLALLSKYGATFLLFFTLFITFAHLFYHSKDFSDSATYARIARKSFLGWTLFILGGIVVFSVLMPAVFFHPDYLYQGLFGFNHSKNLSFVFLGTGGLIAGFLLDVFFLRGKLLFSLLKKTTSLQQPLLVCFSCIFLFFALITLVNWGLGNRFHFEDVPFDANTKSEFTKLDFLHKPFLELKPLIFTTQPIVLLPALFTLVFFIRKRHRYTFLLFSFLTFISFYYIAVLSQNVLVHVRYSILLYPAFIGIASIGIVFLLERFIRNKAMRLFFVALLFLISGWSVWTSHPFYFNYTNDFLPKNKIVTGAWGYGGYEAAQYLNTLPNAERLVIWSDYEGVCPFFKGKCVKGKSLKSYGNKTLSGFDYAVITRRGSISHKDIWDKLKKEEKLEKKPVWELFIGNREKNFVRIYKTKDVFNSSILSQ